MVFFFKIITVGGIAVLASTQFLHADADEFCALGLMQNSNQHHLQLNTTYLNITGRYENDTWCSACDGAGAQRADDRQKRPKGFPESVELEIFTDCNGLKSKNISHHQVLYTYNGPNSPPVPAQGFLGGGEIGKCIVFVRPQKRKDCNNTNAACDWIAANINRVEVPIRSRKFIVDTCCLSIEDLVNWDKFGVNDTLIMSNNFTFVLTDCKTDTETILSQCKTNESAACIGSAADSSRIETREISYRTGLSVGGVDNRTATLWWWTAGFGRAQYGHDQATVVGDDIEIETAFDAKELLDCLKMSYNGSADYQSVTAPHKTCVALRNQDGSCTRIMDKHKDTEGYVHINEARADYFYRQQTVLVPVGNQCYKFTFHEDQKQHVCVTLQADNPAINVSEVIITMVARIMEEDNKNRRKTDSSPQSYCSRRRRLTKDVLNRQTLGYSIDISGKRFGETNPMMLETKVNSGRFLQAVPPRKTFSLTLHFLRPGFKVATLSGVVVRFSFLLQGRFVESTFWSSSMLAETIKVVVTQLLKFVSGMIVVLVENIKLEIKSPRKRILEGEDVPKVSASQWTMSRRLNGAIEVSMNIVVLGPGVDASRVNAILSAAGLMAALKEYLAAIYGLDVSALSNPKLGSLLDASREVMVPAGSPGPSSDIASTTEQSDLQGSEISRGSFSESGLTDQKQSTGSPNSKTTPMPNINTHMKNDDVDSGASASRSWVWLTIILIAFVIGGISAVVASIMHRRLSTNAKSNEIMRQSCDDSISGSGVVSLNSGPEPMWAKPGCVPITATCIATEANKSYGDLRSEGSVLV